MKFVLIKKILKRQLEDEESNLTNFARNEFGITYDALIKKFNGSTKFSFEEVEKIVKYCNGQIKYEDFCKDTISSDQNNTNNDKINVKNSASMVVSSDLKADDGG